MYHRLMAYEHGHKQPEYLYGDIEILKRQEGECVVCGHPTGDCTTETAAPHHIWGITEVPSMADTTMILVEKDVVVYRQITGDTKAPVVLARAGQKVSVSRARELGIV